ncbi:MMB_0454 family protein [Mesomycoplasma neurolyticum]|uniref:Uncharacterized protein n=1 Tax=Mesomycoplasma neurolyticum TaxID=2120 RepID=A0A449A4D4_9BACT|nr:hypothetical protein [Mesomycoplasma neurolyticum]VEU59088.1 Uncharacterised protein [Mesomycoplasma neurolyticum]
MLDYVFVNYGLNGSYLVHKEAFIQAINIVFKKNKKILLDSEIEILFNNENSNVIINASYLILSESENFSQITNFLLNSIKEVVKFLIGVEPDNICLRYNGTKKNNLNYKKR